MRTEFEKRHGTIPGAAVALLGFGKMASREMTMSSDLDFIMLYDVADATTESDGEKPLAASQYFARLTQRLVAAVTAPTSEGVLYDADMRLRPSGNAGPLATSLAGFRVYQEESAWTWEHLALTPRARHRGRLGFRLQGRATSSPRSWRARAIAPRSSTTSSRCAS